MAITTPVSAWWWSNKVEGDGPVKEETRKLAAFTQVTMAGSFSVILQIADGPPQAIIKAQENILSIVRSEVSGDELSLFTSDRYSTSEPIQIALRVPSLKAITLAGSGSFTSRGIIKTEHLAITLASSGDITVQVEVKKLEISIAGSGDVVCRGRTGSLELSVAGSGDFDGAQLSSTSAEVSIAGSGDATVDVTKLLEVSIMGSGDVTYYGKAQVTKTVLGSGSVRPAEPCW
ncbi:MAG: head GIN domain-containing protein [Verrucomicrobiota bacterium]|nr:head GIN domain-containing protein [Verrucomicrobiota bacterium]